MTADELAAIVSGIAPVIRDYVTRAHGELVQRVRDGRLRTNIGSVVALDDAVAAFNRTERIKGKTIIRVRP